jgi:hypothetical protein
VKSEARSAVISYEIEDALPPPPPPPEKQRRRGW